ncbi:NADH-quinone oxidoreductase subunit NuoF [Salinisphaera sp. LB1]|uniref:NADH-quinone oxidoreductase subunit NuoF n=1 Tax=Salinisphaera sp. LB1 TaxID=2183911 RepID=UPI000D7087F2|nr:NADH-quinone oxidoreductase subunit NuoF [Salinisphaera sp. LB1]AWN16410.1 NADH-ubiquinone oxidoreductase chain F [Salinisphaera sp. LB1]
MEETKVLTQRIRPDRSAVWIDDYMDLGGYEALKTTLADYGPAEVGPLIKEAGLRGRGGAGFPTGVKWSFMPRFEDRPDERPAHVYLVVNADEMEPGTFKDRLIMEGDPHQLIEGMIIAAYAIGADTAYVFLRGEYTECRRRLQQAIDEAHAKGFLGENILDSGFSLNLHLHMSAGRYICGEESALLSALEGRRAVPRHKPPFPAASGLFGQPTTVNNVETICNVPHIVKNGADWYKSLGLNKDGGTKLFGASGHVAKPGLAEFPLGVKLGDVLEHFGGIRHGRKLKGLLPGGGSTPFLTPEHLDTPMDYDGVGAAGSRLGTATMVVFDDQTPIVGVLKNLEHFYAQESCGWCTPCRDGLPWVEKMLINLEAGKGQPGDLELLDLHVKLLGPGKTFCAHAPGAMGPLEAGLKYYRDELAALIPDDASNLSRTEAANANPL